MGWPLNRRRIPRPNQTQGALRLVALLVPEPGGAEDVIKLGVAGLPAQFANGFVRAGDENGGISGTTGMVFDGDGMAGDPAGRFDDFANAEALAVAEVQDEAVVRFEPAQGQQMGVGQIGDMDVIADAGAVGGGIVVAIDADRLAASEGYIEDERNEVGFRFVGFAAGDAAGAFRSTRDVEVAERGVAQAVDSIEPLEHVLDEKLGFPIIVGGAEARIFLDRDRLRLAINGGRGRKDQAAWTMGQNRLKEGKGGGGVVTKKELGMKHGLACLDEGGEVENGVEGIVLGSGIDEKFFNCSAIGQVSLDELDAHRNLIALCVAQIIEYNGFVTLRGQQSSDGATDISRTSGNQDLHKKTVLPRTLWFTVSLLQQAGSERPRATTHRSPKRRHPLACPICLICA